MDNLNKSLGTRIRALRVAQDMSQDALAERSGLSVKHLGQIERGSVNASIQCIHAIAGALNVSVRDVLETEHEQSREELIAEIIRLASNLSHKDAQIVYRLMNMLTGR